MPNPNLAVGIEKIIMEVVNKGLIDEKDTATILHEQAQSIAERITVDEEKLSFFIYKYETGLGDELAKSNWTAKHFQDKAKNRFAILAKAIAQADIIRCEER